MSTKIKELRLPIVITADGTKAVAGMRQFQTVGKRLDDTLGKFASRQLSSVGGMLMGYLGVDAALNGMRQLYAYADKIQGLSRSYSPAVSAAYGQRKVAEHKGNQAAGLAAAPLAVEREQIATRVASAQVQKPLAIAAESFALTWDKLVAAAKLNMAGIVTGGDEGARLAMEGTTLGRSAFGLENDTGIGAMLRKIDVMTTGIDPENSVPAQQLAELRGISSALRGNK